MTMGSILQNYAWVGPWVGLWSGVGFVGGVVVAWRRNRWILGPGLGLLLSPLGWWVVARLPGRWRECPACSRHIALGAGTCRHCGSDVNRQAAKTVRSSMKSADRGRGW
jgi:hypothetical protein